MIRKPTPNGHLHDPNAVIGALRGAEIAPSRLEPPALGFGRRWRAAREDVLAIGTLWLLCAAFFFRLFVAFPAGRLHVVAGDFTNQFYPFRFFEAAEWAVGRIPLWNPYVFGGHPFQADIQTAVFYPFSLVTALLGSRFGLPPGALELEMALHYPFAALLTYAFARHLLRGRIGAFLAALAFTFGGFLTSYPAQQLAMLESAVWLPLILLCLDLSLTRRRSVSWAAGAGLAFAVSILAGHPQTALYEAYFAGAFFVVRAWSLDVSWRRAVPAGLLAALVAGGVAAVQILPTAELLGESVRASMPYELAAHGYERRALIGILLPSWRGEKALYVGILPLILAGLVVCQSVGVQLLRRPVLDSVSGSSRATRAMVWFLAIAALLALVLSLGDRGYLYRLAYAVVPGFALFRDQERSVYLFGFALSLLAGEGANRVVTLTRDQSRRTTLLSFGSLAVVLGTGALAATLLYGGQSRPAVFDPQGHLETAIWFYLAMTVLAVAALSVARATVVRWPVGLALCVVLTIDLFGANFGNNLGPTNPDPTPAYAPIVQALLDPAGINAGSEEFRVRGESDEVFPPNYAAVWRLPTINGDTPFMLQRVSNLLFADGAEWRRWQLLNVKFFLAKRPAFEGVEQVAQSGDIRVLRMQYSLPRAWAVRDTQLANSPADALRRVLVPAYHPGDTVILEQPPAVGPLAKGDRPDVRLTSYSSQRIEISAKSSGDALLVLADTYYPGWQAYRDGQRVPIYRANYSSRALDLPTGGHSFVLVFAPDSFRNGAAISLATLLLVVVGLAIRRFGVGSAARPRESGSDVSPSRQ